MIKLVFAGGGHNENHFNVFLDNVNVGTVKVGRDLRNYEFVIIIGVAELRAGVSNSRRRMKHPAIIAHITFLINQERKRRD